MGVYINGMEMPKSCEECILDHKFFKWLGCNKHVSGDTIAEGKRSPACPLVPVPEPHGRLIDASEKIRVQIYDDMTEDYYMVEMTIDDLLCQGWVEANAPTIIPASGGGET